MEKSWRPETCCSGHFYFIYFLSFVALSVLFINLSKSLSKVCLRLNRRYLSNSLSVNCQTTCVFAKLFPDFISYFLYLPLKLFLVSFKYLYSINIQYLFNKCKHKLHKKEINLKKTLQLYFQFKWNARRFAWPKNCNSIKFLTHLFIFFVKHYLNLL
jgi:hypothetical protein